MGHEVTPTVQALVEILLKDLYQSGLDKALAEHLPHLETDGTQH